MLLINNRYEIQSLANKYRLPKIYDLLNLLKPSDDVLAYTDGKDIFVNAEEFNERTAEDKFFILAHESLHIIYGHCDKKYYPPEYYTNREILNVCQDICINEFLSRRLMYKVTDGLYLDNMSAWLIANGYSKWPFTYYGGLTTKQLYDYIMRQVPPEDRDKFTEQFVVSDLASDDMNSGMSNPLLDAVIKDIKSNLKISDSDIDREHEDSAGQSSEYTGTTNSALANIISSKDLVKYINSYIGNNVVIKGRTRSYSRPNRRLQSKDFVLPGFRNIKHINKVSIYLDVSGSMDDSLVNNLFKTLKNLYSKIPFDFYTFNTYINKIDMKTVNSIYIGGGTNIQRVLNEIEKNKDDHAILITDCDDRFNLDKVSVNILLYTNNYSISSNNDKVEIAYFR